MVFYEKRRQPPAAAAGQSPISRFDLRFQVLLLLSGYFQVVAQRSFAPLIRGVGGFSRGQEFSNQTSISRNGARCRDSVRCGAQAPL